MRRATEGEFTGVALYRISIHALHEESDLDIAIKFDGSRIFQSTLSMRRATAIGGLQHFIPAISIHALHEESDLRDPWGIHALGKISIHALHEESDVMKYGQPSVTPEFQSTLSMRRATHYEGVRVRRARYFNPRSP